MARGDIDERHILRLGRGESDLTGMTSTHDFTKSGRVNWTLARRIELLNKVATISESLGVSSPHERGPNGESSYNCDSAKYFFSQYLTSPDGSTVEVDGFDQTEISSIFTELEDFRAFEVSERSEGASLDEDKHTRDESRELATDIMVTSTTELTHPILLTRFIRFALASLKMRIISLRSAQLLRSQNQRANYLLTRQAKIVAMTCTHAALVRQQLIKLDFKFDNIVMEESAQMLDVESFVPLVLQKTKPGESIRLKRVTLIGDHHQLPPVVKNQAINNFSNLSQSLFARLIKLDITAVHLDKQGRSRAGERASLDEDENTRDESRERLQTAASTMN